MRVFVGMLRGINVGGRNIISMSALRELCESLNLENPQTYVQSGNVVFKSKEQNEAKLAATIERALERKFGFRPAVILRSACELQEVIDNNPFAARSNVDPSKLLVTFLPLDPGEEARANVRKIPVAPEELHVRGRELYINYPEGAGRSKLPIKRIEKALGMSGTARNWNSVLKLLEIAETMEASLA